MNWAITPFCKNCRRNRSVKGSKFCEACAPVQHQQERARLNAAKRDKLANDATAREHHAFYKSRKWLRARAEKRKLNPLCEDCEAEGRLVPMAEVDHVQRIKDGGDRFDLANMRSLCRSCHARKRQREGQTPLADADR